MRNILRLLIVASLLCFSGCDIEDKPISSRKATVSLSQYIERNYDEIKDKKIRFADIFEIDKDSYFVYFFSRTCSHCENLKNFIIDQALGRGDIYFVESSNDVVFVVDAESTIGLTDIENFGILGYPSLVKIEEKTVTKNLAGNSSIKKELLIE